MDVDFYCAVFFVHDFHFYFGLIHDFFGFLVTFIFTNHRCFSGFDDSRIPHGLAARNDKASMDHQMILLMVQKSGVHQLRLVVYPIIIRVLCIRGGEGCLPSTV